MRRAPPISLTPLEQARLEAWAALREGAQRLAVRAQVVLEAARGSTNGAIARQLGIHPETVSRWRRRFAVHRLEGVRRDAPRSGRRSTASQVLIERIVRLTAVAPAPNGERWTTRTLARALRVNHMLVHRVWQTHGVTGAVDPSWIDPVFRGRSVRIELVGVFVEAPAAAIVFRVGPSSGDGRPPWTGVPFGISGAYPVRFRPHLPTPLAGFLSEAGAIFSRLGPTSNPVGSPHGLLVFLRGLDEEPEPPNSELHVIFDRPVDLLPVRVTEWLRSHSRFRVSATARGSHWTKTVDEWVRGFSGKFVQSESFTEVGSLLESLAVPGTDLRHGFCWRHGESGGDRGVPSVAERRPAFPWPNAGSI